MTFSREKAILNILVLINVVIFGFILIPYELYTISEYGKELRATGDLKESLENKYAILINSEADASSAKQYLDVLQASIPNNQSLDVFLTDLIEICALNNLSVSSFETQDTNNIQGFNEVPLTVRLQGNPNDLPNFIKSLEELNRISVIKSISYDSVAKNSKIKIDLIVYSYGVVL